MAVKCPVCGAPLENGQCSYCGYVQETPERNEEIRQPGTDTAEMGYEPRPAVDSPQPNPMGIIPGVSRKSKTTALLLCIFLGGLGVHRFYAGKVGTGIIYLLTVGLFGIGWLVDIIRIAAGSFRDGFGLPLRQ